MSLFILKQENQHPLFLSVSTKMSHHNHTLGLPIEYQMLPEFFDAHNINEQTHIKNALIDNLLRGYEVKTILDMTCGTGSQVFFLDERGYDIIGSDFSPALVDIARNKAKQLNRQLTFIEGDMRDIQVGQFDAVITIFNAIGHLSKSDFKKALQNINSNLKDDGIYIFDIFNLTTMTHKISDDFLMDIESVVNGIKIKNVQCSEIDLKNGLLTSHDHYTIFKEGDQPETHTNTFSLQLYTAEELQSLLNSSGFENMKFYDMDGNQFIPDKSLSILTIARKSIKKCKKNY
jgi:SAM-dependent methyltransferase